MINYRERQRLMEKYYDEPGLGLAVIFKCAAGLLVVFGIAVIGIAFDPAGNTVSGVQASRDAQPGAATAQQSPPVRIADDAARLHARARAADAAMPIESSLDAPQRAIFN